MDEWDEQLVGEDTAMEAARVESTEAKVGEAKNVTGVRQATRGVAEDECDSDGAMEMVSQVRWLSCSSLMSSQSDS